MAQFVELNEPIFIGSTNNCRAVNMLNMSNFQKPFIFDGLNYYCPVITNIAPSGWSNIIYYCDEHPPIWTMYDSRWDLAGITGMVKAPSDGISTHATHDVLNYGGGGGGILGGGTTHVSGVGDFGGLPVFNFINTNFVDLDPTVYAAGAGDWGTMVCAPNLSTQQGPNPVPNLSVVSHDIFQVRYDATRVFWIRDWYFQQLGLGFSTVRPKYCLQSMAMSYPMFFLTYYDNNSSQMCVTKYWITARPQDPAEKKGLTVHARAILDGSFDTMFDTCMDEQYLYILSRKMPISSGVVCTRLDTRFADGVYNGISTIGIERDVFLPSGVRSLSYTPAIRDVSICQDGSGNLLAMWTASVTHEADYEYLFGFYPIVYYSISSDRGNTWSTQNYAFGSVTNQFDAATNLSSGHYDHSAKEFSFKPNIIGLKTGGWAVSVIKDHQMSGEYHGLSGIYNRVGVPSIYLVHPVSGFIYNPVEVDTYFSGKIAEENGIRNCIGAAWMLSPISNRVYSDNNHPLKLVVEHGKRGWEYQEWSRHGESDKCYLLDYINVFLDTNINYIQPSGAIDPSGILPSGIIV